MGGDFSVILPARGDSPYLRRSLRSALACAETGEVLLVTGGDGRAAAEADGDPRVRLIERRGPGVSAARNAGIEAARHRHVAFLDDDDVWTPDHLARALETLERHPDATLAGCAAWLWDDPSPDGSAAPPGDRSGLRLHAPGVEAGPISLGALLLRNPITTPSVTLVRERLRPQDRFDPALDHMEDYDLWLRLARDRVLVFDPRPSVIVRRRPGSASRDWRRMAEGSLSVLERHVSRGLPAGTVEPARLRRRLGHLWHELAYACLVEDDLPAARRAALRALAREPARVKSWGYLLASVLPGGVRGRLLSRGRSRRARDREAARPRA